MDMNEKVINMKTPQMKLVKLVIEIQTLGEKSDVYDDIRIKEQLIRCQQKLESLKELGFVELAVYAMLKGLVEESIELWDSGE